MMMFFSTGEPLVRKMVLFMTPTTRLKAHVSFDSGSISELTFKLI